MPSTRLVLAALASIPIATALFVALRRRPTSSAWISRRIARPHSALDCAALHAEPARIRLASGRSLSYAMYGPPSAQRTVLFIHGLPGSRLPATPDLLALAGDTRVICVDRPGYGFSDPDAHGTPASFANDAVELLAALDRPGTTENVHAVGYSLGGPYAIALATLFPSRVSQLTLLAPAGFVSPPGNAMQALGSVNRTAHMLVGNGLGFLLKCAWTLGASMMCDPELYFTGQMLPSLSQADQSLFKQDVRMLALWESTTAESFRQGIQGPLKDAEVGFGVRQGMESAKWGFRVGPLDVPVRMVWGDQDNLVSRAQVEHMFGCLTDNGRRKGELVIAPGLGHFGILARGYWL